MAPSSARKRKSRVLESDDDCDPPKKHVPLSKTHTATKDPKKLTLLTLPAEIRNKIWAHTFDYYDYVNCGRRIDITYFRPFPAMPTAATVCRQMLAEVLGVFLHETKFVIWIDICEGKRDVRANTTYMRLCTLQREVGKVEDAPTMLSQASNRPKYVLSGRPVFGNVVRWAKTVHASDLDLTYNMSEVDGWRKVLSEMLTTTVTLRALPWDTVKKVLISMCDIAGVYDYSWELDRYDRHHLDSDYTRYSGSEGSEKDYADGWTDGESSDGDEDAESND